MPDSIQALCAQGQTHLENTDYLSAERVLVQAEAIAWHAQDWDALARLYMPLQEARRQRRQRALEGAFFTELALEPALATTRAEEILQGQLLVAGEATIAPAIALRKLAMEDSRYLDVFLAAAYRVGEGYVVIIIPSEAIAVPATGLNSIDTLVRRSPPHSIVLDYQDIPKSLHLSDDITGAFVMNLWQQLHSPFLAMADSTSDPVQRIAAYRETIAVDYACELAHQRLSETARELARQAA